MVGGAIMVIAFIIFWCIYYWLEGSHDGYVILDIGSCSKPAHSLKWHMYSMFQHGWLHVIAPLLLATTFWQYFVLLNLSIALRVILHDYFIMAVRFGYKKALQIYPTEDYKGDWWDGMLFYLKNKGVSQYALKLAYVALSLILGWL